MASVNKVILIGNLGKDPEVRTTQAGKSVASFSLATQNGFGDNATTDWHNIVLWEKLADTAAAYLTKGAPVYIEGRVTYRTYEKDGATRYVTEVVGERMQLLGKKPEPDFDPKSDKDEPAPRKKPGRKPRAVEVPDPDPTNGDDPFAS